VDISIAQDEKSRLTQEKQMLENKLEEMRKRILWEDPMMVTEHV